MIFELGNQSLQSDVHATSSYLAMSVEVRFVTCCKVSRLSLELAQECQHGCPLPCPVLERSISSIRRLYCCSAGCRNAITVTEFVAWI